MDCVTTCPDYLIPNLTTGNCDNCNTLSLGFSYNGICNAVPGCPALFTLDSPSRNGCASCLFLGKFYDEEVAMGCVTTCHDYLIHNSSNGNCDNCNALSLGFSYDGTCHSLLKCPALYTLDSPARNGCATCLSIGKVYDGDVAMGCVTACPDYLIPNLTTGNCDNCNTLNLGFSYNGICNAGPSCPALLFNILHRDLL